MSAIFVAGTDTGVGKTVVTGLLARHLATHGYRVATQKWIQTGGGNDLDEHLRWTGRTRGEFRGFLRAMSPYSLRAPASPHLAAELGGTRILESKLRRSLAILSEHFDFVLVEGSGGLMVPVSRKALLIDWVRDCGLPVLLVAGNRLGAINHTLLSLEALETRKMRILGVIFNNLSGANSSATKTPRHQERPYSSLTKKRLWCLRALVAKSSESAFLTDNLKVVRELSGQRVLGVLPWMERPEALQQQFTRVGEEVLAAYERLDSKRLEA